MKNKKRKQIEGINIPDGFAEKMIGAVMDFVTMPDSERAILLTKVRMLLNSNYPGFKDRLVALLNDYKTTITNPKAVVFETSEQEVPKEINSGSFDLRYYGKPVRVTIFTGTTVKGGNGFIRVDEKEWNFSYRCLEDTRYSINYSGEKLLEIQTTKFPNAHEIMWQLMKEIEGPSL